jgi:hypothetical protein
MATSPRSKRGNMPQLTFSLEAPRVNPSRSPVCGEAWPTRAETWPSNFYFWLNDCAPGGSFGRMSPASCRPLEDGTLVPLSEGWGNSGMGGPTEALTLNTSTWPSDASVSSLSDILETGDVPEKYYLSRRACRGILRRAEKRGRELPAALLAELRRVVDGE